MIGQPKFVIKRAKRGNGNRVILLAKNRTHRGKDLFCRLKRNSQSEDLKSQFSEAIKQSSLEKANQLARQILDQVGRVHGLESVELADQKSLLAKEYSKTQFYREAITLLSEAIQLLTKFRGAKDETTLDTRIDLGTALYNKGEYNELEKIALDGLKICDQENPTFPRRYKFLILLGLGYRELGRYDLAVERFNEVIAILKTLNEPEELANCFFNLAIVFFRQKKMNEAWNQLGMAEAEFLNVTNIPEGKRDYYLTNFLELRGSLFAEGDQLDLAEKHFQELVDFRKAQFGERNGLTGHALINLGNVKRRKGDLKAAQRCLFEGISILRERDENPIVLIQAYFNLGDLNRRLGDFRLAIDPLERALDMIKNHLGEFHPFMIVCLKLLARVHADSQFRQFDQAEEILLRALEINEKIQDPSGKIETLYDLMTIAVAKDDLLKAKEYGQSGLDLARQNLPSSRNHFVDFLNVLKQIEDRLG